MKKLGIIYKLEDDLIAGTALKLAKDFSHLFKVTTSLNKMDKVDFILTLGGDGTILRASRFACKNNIPILPVHLGGLGMLSEISLDQISEALNKVKNKEFIIDERLMLKASVVRKNKVVKELLALNDAVICRKEISRTIKLRVSLGNEHIADYISDGLIAATPTGSTAYNFAVMGPILPSFVKAYVLSPICPHRAANRSIVLENKCTIEIIKGDEVLLTTDGQETSVLNLEDKVTIEIAREKTKFIRLKEYDLWGLLRKKLSWG